MVALWALAVALEGELPRVLSVADYRHNALQMSRIYAADGQLLAEVGDERRTLIAAADIPRHVRLAAVAAEDADFYEHEGVDLPGMLRALAVNLRDGRYSQGASTISQQVARSFYLSSDKTLRRKALEVLLALRLERRLTKDEILELYLNQIYFGCGRYGIEEAARHYLGKRVRDLDVADAALLMSVVPAPERLHPFADPSGCAARRDRILRRMAGAGFITDGEAEEATGRPLRLADPQLAGPAVHAPWFVDVVRRHLERALGPDALRRRGLRIHTTLLPAAQAGLDEAIRVVGASLEPEAEVAVVVLDPVTKEVLALVGGRDFLASPFNRAVQARRQAGSTFKPFVFGAGIERGVLRPETTYANTPATYRGARGPWRPLNADGQHDGAQVTLREALARSLNVVAVKVLRDVGVSTMVDFARRVGVRSAIPRDLSAALGSAEVSPLELAAAYATLADRGRRGQPVLVRRVEGPRGRLLYAEEPAFEQAIPAAVAATVVDMLRAVVEEGTGRAAELTGTRVAGKTGTSDGRVDAWFAGFTDDGWLATVWVGRDDGRPLARGSGGGTAAPIWAEVMRRARYSRPP